jgi:hypothetical protein
MALEADVAAAAAAGPGCNLTQLERAAIFFFFFLLEIDDF